MDEHEIPEGWADATIGDLVRVGRERIDPQTHPDFPYIGLEDVDPHSLGLPRMGRAGDMRSASVHFRPGDVLYGRLRPYLNKVVSPDFEGLCSAEFIPLVPADGVLARFLKLRMNCEDFVAFASHLNEGDRPRVDFEQVAGFPLVLPPTAEQHRILAKLDELLSRVKTSRDRLSRVPGILKRFRQAVLAAACSGRLTEVWRRRHELSESGTDLVNRLCGKNSACEPLFDLPAAWTWSTCTALTDRNRTTTYGVIKLGDSVEGGIPTLRSSDVRWLRIDTSSVKQIAPAIAANYSRTFLRGGEIVVTVRGTLGGVAVVPPEMKGFNISREVAMIALHRELDAGFFCLAIAGSWSQNWLLGVAKGVAYTGINIGDLKELPLPVPPIDEQHEIVRRVEALLALADSIEARLGNAVLRADRLTQAVLAKAFRGELVPTEAELARQEGRPFESADELLARIRATPVEARPRRGPRGRLRSNPT